MRAGLETLNCTIKEKIVIFFFSLVCMRERSWITAASEILYICDDCRKREIIVCTLKMARVCQAKTLFFGDCYLH